jgi:hypothetical protein
MTKLTLEEIVDTYWDCDDWNDDTLDLLAASRVPGFVRHETGVVRFEEPTIVAGDLVVDGDLECLSHSFVLGNLTCTGYVYSGIHDSVVVCGDVTARAIDALRSYWLVGGTLTATTAWYSMYGRLHGFGELRAGLLVLEKFDLLGPVAVHATTRIETEGLDRDPAALAALAEVVDLDRIRDAEGNVSSWELLRLVARGELELRRRRA